MIPTNLLQPLPAAQAKEMIDTLARGDGMRIERIVSHGQCSPPGFWYEQDEDEWIVVMAGLARLQFDDGRLLEMKPGDQLNIRARRRHRVDWTAPDMPTVWLAVYYRPLAQTTPEGMPLPSNAPSEDNEQIPSDTPSPRHQ